MVVPLPVVEGKASWSGPNANKPWSGRLTLQGCSLTLSEELSGRGGCDDPQPCLTTSGRQQVEPEQSSPTLPLPPHDAALAFLVSH